RPPSLSFSIYHLLCTYSCGRKPPARRRYQSHNALNLIGVIPHLQQIVEHHLVELPIHRQRGSSLLNRPLRTYGISVGTYGSSGGTYLRGLSSQTLQRERSLRTQISFSFRTLTDSGKLILLPDA